MHLCETSDYDISSPPPPPPPPQVPALQVRAFHKVILQPVHLLAMTHHMKLLLSYDTPHETIIKVLKCLL